jgi:asparagine synthase (glutamine-hydrolysing)
VSGIVGIINLDGAPIDRLLLQELTDFLIYRGPDRQDIWVDGSVGFGHTLLRTTYEAEQEKQPFSLDGEVWITADARIDGRAELIHKLKSKGRNISGIVPDVELILNAYLVWGEECLQHLIGDFAFAIWDKRRRCIFCARDHLGVKPFYYAYTGQCLIFSNTLKCVQLHPAVSGKLNDLAVGDFLLFGFNQDSSTTTFADIRRVPPAHFLTWSGKSVEIDQYWSLPFDGHIRYSRASDYVDHFIELLGQAVEDRLRVDDVAVLMSGGLDSTAVAAIANKVGSSASNRRVRAYTATYDHLLCDEDGYYAGLVAKALSIPIHFLVADEYRLFERCEQPELQPPEPYEEPLRAVYLDQLNRIAQHSRVVLTGQGADPILSPPEPHYSLLLRTLQFRKLFAAVMQYRLAYGEFPRFQVGRRLRYWFGLTEKARAALLPSFLSDAFAAELERVLTNDRANAAPVRLHPTRPEAYEQLDPLWWSCIFEQNDAGWTYKPVEVRHPFFDIRLVEYALAIPGVPWCMNKAILRLATRGLLSDDVRRRPKSYFVGDPVSARLQRGDVSWLEYFQPPVEAFKYIKEDALKESVWQSSQGQYPSVVQFRPFYLAVWLQQIKSQTTALKGGQYNGITY